MPATTRASARRASGVPTPPRPTPWLVESAPPPRAPSPILGEPMINPIVAAPASNQDVNTSSRPSSAPKPLLLKNVIDSVNSRFALVSSPAPSNGSYDDGRCDYFEGLDGFEGIDGLEYSEQPTSPSSFSSYSLKALTAPTRSSEKLSKNTQTIIKPGQQFISFSKPAQSSPGIFSRA